jgi:two-component system, response regulator PdtaR
MRLSLEEAGFRVCGIVSTGAAALEKAAEAGPDIVLMDVNLKEGPDGIDTARELQPQRAGMSIIFVTGLADAETSERIRTVNASGYLVKPVMPQQLEAAIIQALKIRADE